MSASFNLSPPYKCNLYTISYNPTLALQGSYTYSSTYTNIPQYLFTTNTTATTTHTHTTHTTTPLHPHTTTHTPTHTHQHIPLSPPHTHLHTYTTPNTLICTPSPPKHKTLHYNIFKFPTSSNIPIA